MIKFMESKETFIVICESGTTVDEVLAVLNKKGLTVFAISQYEPGMDWNLQGRLLYENRESELYKAKSGGSILFEVVILRDQVPEFKVALNKAIAAAKREADKARKAEAILIAQEKIREAEEAMKKAEETKKAMEEAKRAAGLK